MKRKNQQAASIIESASSIQTPSSGAFWEELHTFVAVAKLGSTTRAAEALNRSRSTVARHVRRLQDLTKTELVLISNYGAMLTDKGRELYEELTSVDDRLAAIIDNIKQKPGAVEGSVRVGMTDGFSALFFVPSLRAFSEQYPGVSITLKRPLGSRDLRENKIDIMVSFAPEVGTDVLSRQMGTVHLYPFASKAYFERCGVPSPGHLVRHQFVSSARYENGEIWEPWRHLAGQGRIVHRCDASVPYGLMIKAGVGIGLLPTYNLFEPSLEPLDLGVDIAIPFFVIVVADKINLRAIRAVYNAVCLTFERSSRWFTPKLHLDVSKDSMPEGYRMLLNLA